MQPNPTRESPAEPCRFHQAAYHAALSPAPLRRCTSRCLRSASETTACDSRTLIRASSLSGTPSRRSLSSSRRAASRSRTPRSGLEGAFADPQSSLRVVQRLTCYIADKPHRRRPASRCRSRSTGRTRPGIRAHSRTRRRRRRPSPHPPLLQHSFSPLSATRAFRCTCSHGRTSRSSSSTRSPCSRTSWATTASQSSLCGSYVHFCRNNNLER